MPIFAQGVPKNKLTILYFVRSANIDLMREQIHRAMVENDCMSYFDFQTAMYEMEQDGMIAAIPRAFGQAYRITASGESVLSMFEESLPFSLRQRLADYADSARESMRLERSFGFTVVPFGQGFKDMSPPTKEQMKLVLEERIAHGGHPVLRWMMDNIYIRTDPAGNIKPDKEKSTEKIDGAVATVMALDRAIRCGNNTSESVYDSRGLLFI